MSVTGRKPKNVINRIALLVRDVRHRQGLKATDVCRKMAELLADASFDMNRYNYLFGREEVRPNTYYDLRTLLALVEASRFSADEAFQLFSLARVPLGDFRMLKRCFGPEEYRRAWIPYIETASGMGGGFVPPPLPGLLVGRERDFAELYLRLGVQGPAERRAVTALWGLPGSGKSALVNALASDATGKVRRVFPDGTLWLELGPRGDLLAHLRRWASQLGVRDAALLENIRDAAGCVRQALRERRVLVVADDVWRREDGDILCGLVSANSAVLFTTRFAGVAHALVDMPADVYRLPRLSREASLDILRQLAPRAVSVAGQHINAVIEVVDGLPLGLRAAASRLESTYFFGFDVERLVTALKNRFSAWHVKDSEGGDGPVGEAHNLRAQFDLSLGTLSPRDRAAFVSLGEFVSRDHTLALKEIQADCVLEDPEATLSALVSSGLLEPLGRERFYLHPLLGMYARHLSQHAPQPVASSDAQLARSEK